MFALIGTIARFGILWAGRALLAYTAYDIYKTLTSEQKGTMQNSAQAAGDAGMTQDDAKQLVAAGVYEKVEAEGKNPDDFWSGLTQEEKDALEFSPESLRRSMDRTKFGGFASAFFFVAALAAAGIAAKRGIPIGLKTIAKIAEARKSGASALQMMTIFEEGKILAIGKVWIPGLVSTIAGGMGWLTSSMVNNMNDADLWGRIFLGQAADDFEKGLKAGTQTNTGGGSGLTTPQGPRTIIRMTEELKPKQFLGTLFSAKFGKLEHFDRKLDDEITDMDDLETDVKLNVNHWLQTLPGRMGYSIVIRKDPVDENGVQQSGIWATATLHILQLSGKILPIDTILLGPVTPEVRMEIARSTKTVETQLDGLISANEIRELQLPNGIVDIFTPSGERMSLDGTSTPVKTPTPSTPTIPSGAATLEAESYDLLMKILGEGKIGSSNNVTVKKIGNQLFTYPGNELVYKGTTTQPGKVSAPAPTPTPEAKPPSGSGSLANSGTLRKGSSGAAVRELQQALNLRGAGLVVDGDFGSKTEAAVKNFQSTWGLTVDGIVGPQTKTKLFAVAYGAGNASLTG